MGDRPKVLVSLLTWNQRADTLECLESLQKVRYPNLDIAVVDNGSTDGTAEAIREKFPHVCVIRNKKNLGATGGWNTEIAHALSTDMDYMLRLGNDTIVDPEVVQELLRVIEQDPDIGIVSPKVYYYDRPDMIWYARGARMNWQRGNFEGVVQNVRDDGSYDEPCDFDFYPGSFNMLRRSVLETGETFDPSYFIYWEDPDWYLRVKQHGFRFVYVPKAKVWHKPSSAVGMESPAFYYYRIRNQLLFMKKNAKPAERRQFMPRFCKEYLWHVAYPLAREGKWSHLGASAQGIWDYCTGNFGQWKHHN